MGFCTIWIRCDCWGNEYYLEKSTSGGSVTLRTGITGQGDGEMYGVAKQWNKVGEKGF
jgi:hypothetical protein